MNKITQRLQEVTTPWKIIRLFTTAPLCWLLVAFTFLCEGYSPFELYFCISLGAFFGIVCLFYFFIKSIVKARRKIRVSALKIYFYVFVLFFHSLFMMYLYQAHIFTSWKSLLITIPVSVGLCIAFLLRIMGKSNLYSA